MGRYLCLLWILLMVSISSQAKKYKDVEVAEALLERLIPAYADMFRFEKIASGKDFFRIKSDADSVIVISGNNANSMATGLNYYLKYYCLTTVSWYADIPIEMPDKLPQVVSPIEVSAKVERRFFLNYCTFGYSMPFWKWHDWERFIDWMALNGINMPLAITGQEAVWYKVWKELGLSDDEILASFTGPVYLPWNRMANIDAWNGPLPMEWIDKQVELQKRILARERELNMKPVLPAFNGHVPAALKKIYPEADIQSLGKWAGFAKDYHCYFLNPEEPLFALIQKKFLKKQTRIFGTDHIYGIDPFNEGDPPSWEPDYLRNISLNLYRTLAEVDSKAEWLQMGWMFYFDRRQWTSPRIKAFLEGVPEGRLSMLDYHCENVELWKTTKSFYGQPYIWCYLGNFGGNTGITGNIKESGRRLDFALENGGNNLKGIGSTLEGLDVIQFPYEYILEKAWTIDRNDCDWVNALADRHAGFVSQPIRDAWKVLFNDIYVQVPKTVGILPNYRPAMGKNSSRASIEYSNTQLLQAWKMLLSVSDVKRDALKLDVISVGRQLLGNYFNDIKNEFDEKYQSRDLEALKRLAPEMYEILQDIDKLTSYHVYTSLDKWVSDAREYSENSVIKAYYEKNARNLITTWGGTLNDYASRTWSGLVSKYYFERWRIYIDAVLTAVEEGKVYNQTVVDEQLKDFESSWLTVNYEVRNHSIIEKNLLEYSRFLLKKYESKILGQNIN